MANVFLGTEQHRGGWLSQRTMRAEYSQLCNRLKISIDPDVRAGSLTVAQQQSLEIMRALRAHARLLLFDEPTASLAQPERQTLLGVIRDLAAAGMTVAFVSHQLDEVLDVSDTVTVLRNGHIVARGDVGEFSKQRLIQEMVGGAAAEAGAGPAAERPPRVAGARTLVVSDLHLDARVDHVSLAVSPGEVVGLAGLVGAGRSSILRSLAGAEPRAGGLLTVGGIKSRVPRSIRAARRLGISLLPEDRKTEGLISERSVEDNISLSRYGASARWGFVRRRAQREISDEWRDRVHLTAYRTGVRSRMLSGGNQQKVLLARVLQVKPEVILADEPTRGVDVAAKEQVLDTLRAFADNGGSVIMTSSEIEEVLSVSDRIYVIHAGRVAREITDVGPHVSIESVLASSFGHDDA
jgi:rhamnose transport system ATP-binding protein